MAAFKYGVTDSAVKAVITQDGNECSIKGGIRQPVETGTPAKAIGTGYSN